MASSNGRRAPLTRRTWIETGESVMKKLEEHRVAFQAELAGRVTMKFTPHLVFQLDESIARGSRIVEILQQIDGDEKKDA